MCYNNSMKKIKNSLSFTFTEIASLLTKLKNNERSSGTIDIEINVTLKDRIIWRTSKNEKIKNS